MLPAAKYPSHYFDEAREAGRLLASLEYRVCFGGGGIGLMGALADGVFERKGSLTGIIPAFMQEAGWGNPKVKDMVVVDSMHERKKQMLEISDAVLALPGGIGTLEELTEAITLKQMGLFAGPIIILNSRGFYNTFPANDGGNDLSAVYASGTPGHVGDSQRAGRTALAVV